MASRYMEAVAGKLNTQTGKNGVLNYTPLPGTFGGKRTKRRLRRVSFHKKSRKSHKKSNSRKRRGGCGCSGGLLTGGTVRRSSLNGGGSGYDSKHTVHQGGVGFQIDATATLKPAA